MNKAQKITIAVALIFMAIFSGFVRADITKYEYHSAMMFFLFMGGAIFTLFSLKKKK